MRRLARLDLRGVACERTPAGWTHGRGETGTALMIRWAIAFVRLALTFNPTPYNYVTSAQAPGTQLSVALRALLILLVGYVVCLRATLRSIGAFGMALVLALVGARSGRPTTSAGSISATRRSTPGSLSSRSPSCSGSGSAGRSFAGDCPARPMSTTSMREAAGPGHALHARPKDPGMRVAPRRPAP